MGPAREALFLESAVRDRSQATWLSREASQLRDSAGVTPASLQSGHRHGIPPRMGRQH